MLVPFSVITPEVFTFTMASKTGVSFLKGSALITAITSVCASGFLLFGYDQVATALLTLLGVISCDFRVETDKVDCRVSCPASLSQITSSRRWGTLLR